MLQSDLRDQHKIVGVDFFIESADQPMLISQKQAVREDGILSQKLLRIILAPFITPLCGK
jgi:hypothetical protein